MGLFGTLKAKLGEGLKERIVARASVNLAEKWERGDFGPTAQKIYIATKGQKTFIGTILSTITLAVAEFAPPWAEVYTRNIALVIVGLTGLSLLDKLRRSQPIFPLWFSDALGRITATLTGLAAAAAWLSSQGWLDHWLAAYPGATDEVTFYATAIMTSVGFLNRLVNASATLPKSDQAAAIDGSKGRV